MLGASGAMLQGAESAAGAAASADGGAQAAASVVGVGEIGDGEDSKGSGGGGSGNRWPRQETLALLKIRSDMDVVFRDSSLKGPLWEEVSRKMADLGYHRSSKKCKEKFENVYKYHKRTKQGRAAKSDGKTYRFFDQLQALEGAHSILSPPLALPPPPPPAQAAVPISMAMPPPQPQPPPSITAVPAQVTVTSTNPVGQQSDQPSVQPAIPIAPIMQNANAVNFQSSPSGTPTSTSSSSTSSDEEILGMRRKRKRKWKDFFERLMKKVIVKQEDLQQKFLEAIEKREHDRMAREEAWKVQEMARLNREHEILVQERSMAAAKDAALISFLQKLSSQQQIPLPVTPPVVQPQRRTPTPTPTPTPCLVQLPQQTQELKNPNAGAIIQVPAAPPPQQLEVLPARTNNGDPSGGYLPAGASSSRWPKTEVEALINLRTILDQKYQETGPKGPLWEEISSEMKKLGYNRNAKRCKEKWENINKYFKKVKESNKKRPEDSKTCPYFNQLDALYRKKNKVEQGWAVKSHQPAAVAPVAAGVEAMAAPIMAQPEQQWPLPQSDHNMDQDRDEEEDDEDEEDEEDEDEDDQGDGYEIVANTNNGSSMGGATAATAASS